MKPLLEIEKLRVSFEGERPVNVLSGVSFSIQKGETLALVGESGCGKSVIAHAVMRLLPSEARVKGSVRFKGTELLELDEKRMSALRGNELAIIFQNPSHALNPVYSIGRQLAEPLRVHQKQGKPDPSQKVLKALKQVGFSRPEHYMKYYPSWCSGGMNQRFLIATSTILGPELLIADEPSKGLDPDRIKEVERELRAHPGAGKTALLLISHDLGFVRRLADKIAVMYSGEIVELAEAADFFEQPLHPYSLGLLGSLPENGFVPIPGSAPALTDPPSGCRFHPRCPYGEKRCLQEHPQLKETKGRFVRCFL